MDPSLGAGTQSLATGRPHFPLEDGVAGGGAAFPCGAWFITLEVEPWGRRDCSWAVVIWPPPPGKPFASCSPPEKPSRANPSLATVFVLGAGSGGCPPENPPVFVNGINPPSQSSLCLSGFKSIEPFLRLPARMSPWPKG